MSERGLALLWGALGRLSAGDPLASLLLKDVPLVARYRDEPNAGATTAPTTREVAQL